MGLSLYEAKCYTTLVEASTPLNGYEVAKRSGVPRSAVYEVLKKLVARSAAYEVAEGDGAAYVPLSPAMLMSRFRSHMDDTVNSLESGFASLASPVQASLTHPIDGHRDLLDRCRDVVMSASTDVFVSVWPDELDELRPVLRRVADQGVDVSVICFGDPGERVGYTYQHEFSSPDQVLDNVGCKLMVVAADRERAVIGGVDEDNASWGTYTDDVAVVAVAVEYVRHDIAMQLLMRRMNNDEGIAEYWRTSSELERLRDHGEPAERLRQMAKARGRR